MSAPVPRRVEERAVRLDYGQFCLCGHPSPDADYMTLLEQAINGSGIAADDNGVIVISPHQNNFEMPFRLEVWDDPPPIGPGFVNRGWPGSTIPGDRWRVQLWSPAGDIPVRRLKQWRQPAV
ncbi:hypothetical protein [Micromonospora zamorensis]|uniref:hypothetical protein n=1 Tax=Micromonospora zamorensis TaxID=709883 RepID=UPI0033B28F0E